MGQGEVPGLMDTTTLDPFADFELEFETQDPKVIFGIFDYLEEAYEYLTTPRPPDHVCLEWGWFGQCIQYGVPTTTSTTTSTTLYNFDYFLSTTSTTTTTSNTMTCKSPYLVLSRMHFRQ